jgi:hypothetical protein
MLDFLVLETINRKSFLDTNVLTIQPSRNLHRKILGIFMEEHSDVLWRKDFPRKKENLGFISHGVNCIERAEVNNEASNSVSEFLKC